MGLLCSFLGHRHETSVWYDDQEFRSACMRCGADMVKDGMSGEWRLLDERDRAETSRRERPVRQREPAA